MAWNSEILAAINRADDLKIAPFHPDMKTTGTPTWIWAVVVDNRLFVRAYFGTSSRWFQAALQQKAGKIHAAGAEYAVDFVHIMDNDLNDKINAAYREKYASSRYVSHMTAAAAKAATVEITPSCG